MTRNSTRDATRRTASLEQAREQAEHEQEWNRRGEQLREQEWEMAQKLLSTARALLRRILVRSDFQASLTQVSKMLDLTSKLGRLSARLADHHEVPPDPARAAPSWWMIAWSRKFAHRIQNLRALENEALAEQSKVSRRACLENLGEDVRRIRGELLKRDLGDIPTARLLTLAALLRSEANRVNGPVHLSEAITGDAPEEDQIANPAVTWEA